MNFAAASESAFLKALYFALPLRPFRIPTKYYLLSDVVGYKLSWRRIPFSM